MSTISRTRTTPKRLDLGCAGIVMTPAEFDAVREYDPLYRYELIRGVLTVSPIPAEAEADPNGELEFDLRLYKSTHPEGAALDKTLAERYVPVPNGRRRADRVIWAGLGRLPDPKVDLPTIIVEFVSRPKRDWLRDYEEKRVEYLGLGVSEHWVIDRFQRTLTVFRNPPAEPVELVLDASSVYRTPLLPGFELRLAKLLAIADLWKAQT
ncbi:MAG: hypothetical protein JWN86_3867 [Planctomycetota bacterium]|nr:hypothetical protein [Planctomycetota bacterium]